MDHRWACIDGNEATARVAYALSEVIALYPVTPVTPVRSTALQKGALARRSLHRRP